jgi:predicted nucleotidyltransferase
MDATSESYAANVATAISTLLGLRLVGVYLHGSAVLGGFDIRRSDIDVLVVCKEPITAAEQSAAADALSEDHLPCPARGLELSIVTLAVTQCPSAAPAYELHMTTASHDTKVIDGHRHRGDPDLILHFAVCRATGRLLGPGLPATDVFGPLSEDLVLAQLSTELRWSANHFPGEYAVLNACRAWRFAVDGAIVSKIDGGRWALDRTPDSDHVLIERALDHQRCRPAADLDPKAVTQFVGQVRSYLDKKLADISICKNRLDHPDHR